MLNHRLGVTADELIVGAMNIHLVVRVMLDDSLSVPIVDG